MIYEVNRDGVGGKHLRLRLVVKTQLQNASPATFPPFFVFPHNKNTIVSQKTLTLHCCCVAADLTCIQLDLISENEGRKGGSPPPGEQIQREAAREEKFKLLQNKKKNRRAPGGSSGRRKILPPQKKWVHS